MNIQKGFIDLISIIIIGLFIARNTNINNTNLLILLLLILFILNVNEIYNVNTCSESFNSEPCSLTDLQKLFDNFMEKKETFESIQKINSNTTKKKRKNRKNRKIGNNQIVRKLKNTTNKCYNNSIDNIYGAPLNIAYNTNFSIEDFNSNYMY